MNTNHFPNALVTGASRGLGKSIADTLAQAGYPVIGTSTSLTGAHAVDERLKAINPNAMGLKLDLNDQSDLTSFSEKIRDLPTPPLILINNAGVTEDALLLRMTDDQWNTVIETNLSSVFKLTKLCIKPMVKAQFGRIVNISSIVAATGNAGQSNYTASKAGMVGFTKSIAREFGSRNITANCIAPGFIETDMTDKLSQKQKENLTQQIPLSRLGKPQDIADAVLFLIQQGSYITGQTLHINGGMFLG